MLGLGIVMKAERMVMNAMGKTGPEHKGSCPVERDDSEWRAKLSPEAYNILREDGTEAPGSSPLNEEKREGLYRCAGCGQTLFTSHAKYDSGSGWPSFYEPVTEEAVGLSKDYKIGAPRTEVYCARCCGHLGHVFEDGPQPTGLRYCMNGAALQFEPGAKA